MLSGRKTVLPEAHYPLFQLDVNHEIHILLHMVHLHMWMTYFELRHLCGKPCVFVISPEPISMMDRLCQSGTQPPVAMEHSFGRIMKVSMVEKIQPFSHGYRRG